MEMENVRSHNMAFQGMDGYGSRFKIFSITHS